MDTDVISNRRALLLLAFLQHCALVEREHAILLNPPAQGKLQRLLVSISYGVERM